MPISCKASQFSLSLLEEVLDGYVCSGCGSEAYGEHYSPVGYATSEARMKSEDFPEVFEKEMRNRDCKEQNENYARSRKPIVWGQWYCCSFTHFGILC